MTPPGRLLTSDDAGRYIEGWSASPATAVAVVAAAGRGTRLGFHLPKILYPVNGRPILAWLADRLAGLVGSLTLVVGPDGARAVAEARLTVSLPLTTAVQSAPTGMADAVLAGEPPARDAGGPETVVVLWGDQIGIRRDTIASALAVHARHPDRPALTVPLAEVERPYVHYEFDATGRLVAVRQQREGDRLPDHGLADCGCFVLTPSVVFPMLRRARAEGLLRGRISGEENFLQALPVLAREASLIGLISAAAADTIGLNSASDLERLVRATGATPPSPDQ